MGSYNTRVGASAVIVHNGAILLVSFDEPGVGFHYNLPGGGLEPGENAHDAVRREALEEASAEIDVGRLLLIWEYEPPDSVGQHEIKLVFEGTLKDGCTPGLSSQPDPYQLGVEWVRLDDLPATPLLPPIAKRLLAALRAGPLDDLYIPLRN